MPLIAKLSRIIIRPML